MALMRELKQVRKLSLLAQHLPTAGLSNVVSDPWSLVLHQIPARAPLPLLMSSLLCFSSLVLCTSQPPLCGTYNAVQC